VAGARAEAPAPITASGEDYQDAEKGGWIVLIW
jgi:hypothetical protein